MRRRLLLDAAAGVTLAGPLSTLAQRPTMPVIGYLSGIAAPGKLVRHPVSVLVAKGATAPILVVVTLGGDPAARGLTIPQSVLLRADEVIR